MLDITLTPTNNRPDDVYVMWLGPLHDYEYPTYFRLYQPFPDDIVVVASELRGLVWWDDNADGIPDPLERGIPGVRVYLHYNVNGQPGAVVQYPAGGGPRYRITDEYGRYHFTYLLSGSYIVVIHRGDQIDDNLLTFYHEYLPIYSTYVARNRFGAAAIAQNRPDRTVVSTVITVPMDTSIYDVDFGFHASDPRIALDKDEAQLYCPEGFGVCEVYWDVTIRNVGSTPLTGVRLYDRMNTLDGRVFDITATGMIQQEIIQVASGSTHMLALTSDGQVLAWGTQTTPAITGGVGSLGNGSLGAPNAGPQFVVGPGSEALLSNIIQISAGWHHSVALTADGTLYAWGHAGSGRLGWGGASSVHQPRPAPVVAGAQGGARLTGITQISAGYAHTLAIDEDGSVWMFGSGYNRGDGGGTGGVVAPIRIPFFYGPDSLTVIAVSAGQQHSLALTACGRV
jgi:hypothetical protein